MKALLLAAGPGEKLDPFTAVRPKSVLPLANKPLILYLMEFLNNCRIKDIGVVVGYKADIVKDILEENSNQSIHYFVQDQLNGPIGAILSAEEFIDQTTIIICADSFFLPSMLEKVIDIHLRKGSIATLACGAMDYPLYHFKAISDDNSKLKKIVKIEEQIRKNEIIAGLAVVEKEIMKFVKQRKGNCEWEEFFLWLSEVEKVEVYGSDDVFADMDYPWEIESANRLAVKYLGDKQGNYISDRASIHETVVFEGTNIIEDDVVIEPWCVIRDSWIGKGTRVMSHSYVQDGFLGEKCRLGPGCFVNGGIAGDNSVIGYNTSYKAISLGKVDFWHEGHVIGLFDDGSTASGNFMCTGSRSDGATIKIKIKGELVDSKLGNFNPMVGKNVRISAGVKIMPGRKIGHNSIVGPGVVVYRDIPPNTIFIIRQDIEKKERVKEGE